MDKVINIKGKIDEEIFDRLSWCDLITEDKISEADPQFQSLFRCYDHPSECSECEVRIFLRGNNYKELFKEYGGKMRYNLREWSWEKRKRPNQLEKRRLIVD